MRAADRSRRHDHLPLGLGYFFHPPAKITNTGRAAAFHDDPGDQGVGVHGEVGPGGRRVQVGVRGGPAPSITLRDLVEAGAVLRRAVEVLVGGQPAFLGGGHEGAGERGLVLEVGHAERPGDAVVGRGAAGVVLRAEEIREYVRVSPPAAPVLVTPGVVVEAVAPDVDHRVHRRGPAERAPARPVDRPAGRPFLRHGVEVPVVLALEEQVQRGRDVYLVGVVRRARFQQQDPGRGVLGKPCSEDTSSAACAHDDVVVHGDLTGQSGGLADHPTQRGPASPPTRKRILEKPSALPAAKPGARSSRATAGSGGPPRTARHQRRRPCVVRPRGRSLVTLRSYTMPHCGRDVNTQRSGH